MQKAHRLISGLWLGTIVFFSVIIAPQIFRILPRPEAANLQNQLFPLYYIVGASCGLSLFILDLFSGRKKIFWIVLAFVLAVVGFTILTPLIREAYVSQDGSMKWLHPTAIVLNVIMLICVAIFV